MKKIFPLIFCAILYFSCNENSPLTVERVIDNSPIEGELKTEKEVRIGEHLPKFIYHKIVEQPFVKERISVLEEQGTNHVFWVNKSEVDSNKIEIQFLAEDESRWIPNFNFMYDFKDENLFHKGISIKTQNDTLILME